MTALAAKGPELFPGETLLPAAFALLAGLLLPLSLAPFNFWWSGFVSIVMLLSVLEGAAFRQALLRWYLFGIGHFTLGASWVYVSIHDHGGANIFLAGTLTGLFVAGVALTTLIQGYFYQRYFAGLTSLWLVAFPAVWFVKEWSMTWLLSGFPWSLLGYGHTESLLSGFAPLGGVLGLGFLVALVSSLFFAGVVRVRQFRLLWWTGIAVIFVSGWLLSFVSFTQPSSEPVSVSLVQGNVAQETKWRREMVEPIINTYDGLTQDEWGRDLVVWPEAAITLFEDSASSLLSLLDVRGQGRNTTLLLGIPSREGRTYYNSAVVVGAGEGKYTKRHLVPFGEYVPFENYLRGVIEFFDLPMSHNKPGPADQVLLTVGGLPMALSICYEIAFPNLVRQDSGKAVLLATISNDTWFGKSLGPHQHMQMAQMRALENGKYLLRGTNNGITAIVNHKGRIEGQLPQFEQGVLRGLSVPMEVVTPYTRFGDLPLLVSFFAILGWLVFRRAG